MVRCGGGGGSGDSPVRTRTLDVVAVARLVASFAACRLARVAWSSISRAGVDIVHTTTMWVVAVQQCVARRRCACRGREAGEAKIFQMKRQQRVVAVSGHVHGGNGNAAIGRGWVVFGSRDTEARPLMRPPLPPTLSTHSQKTCAAPSPSPGPPLLAPCPTVCG